MAGTPARYAIALRGIVWREILRFAQQRGRLAAALVRPLLWLMIFATGFRAAVTLSLVPPYDGAVSYETYVVPGLAAMVLLFNSMQSSLSMVYDREMGSMRVLLTSPLPRWYLLLCRLVAGACVSSVQAYAFLLIADALVVDLPLLGYLAAAPMLLAASLMLGALGMVLSSTIRQLENFAGIMNFVIFPMFFLSPALYPQAHIAQSSALMDWLCTLNPFTYAAEGLRHALYLRVDVEAIAATVLALGVFFALSVAGYDARTGLVRRKAE